MTKHLGFHEDTRLVFTPLYCTGRPTPWAIQTTPNISCCHQRINENARV